MMVIRYNNYDCKDYMLQLYKVAIAQLPHNNCIHTRMMVINGNKWNKWKIMVIRYNNYEL